MNTFSFHAPGKSCLFSSFHGLRPNNMNFSVMNGTYINSAGVTPDGGLVFAGFDNELNAYTY
jgi:hypothetical protein